MKKFFGGFVCLTLVVLFTFFSCSSSPRNSGDTSMENLFEQQSNNMVRINGGTFIMGSPSREPMRNEIEDPQFMVTLSPFYIGNYEVTQKEYMELMGTNPSHFKGDNLPVEQVSWFDAIEYCNRLSEREGLTLAYIINGDSVKWNHDADGYRLPTEAEWEYACRAGTTTPFSTGKNITTKQANYNGTVPYNNNSPGENRRTTTQVGTFTANPWGLYDMHGNVWEWCWDWRGYSYSKREQTDPIGAFSGIERVLRGGAWYYGANTLRSAYRYRSMPSSKQNHIGFRVVRSVK